MRALRFVPAAILVLTAVPAAAADRDDVVLADFEGDDYGDWKAAGEAFGKGPARGTLPNQMPVSGYRGRGLVNSYLKGDDTTGTLTSPEFALDRKRVNFLIGGGHHPGKCCVNLLIDGKEVRTATGASQTGQDSERLAWHSWEVAEFAGRKARIEIIDRQKGNWGHINIDHIVLSDREPPKPADERDELLARAEESVKQAAAKVKDDPNRPTYHLLPPAQWMNDPNGPVFHKGYYHLFYQHNPYGDKWGHMHWGHFRSKDMVRWEHQPIALWPSLARGEEHVFSGCAAVTPDDKLMLIYTSIGRRAPEQWAAVAEDDAATRFKKHPANPLLTLKDHGGVKVEDWRDPFVFKHGGKWYMVVGGHREGGRGAIFLYTSDDLTKWTYLGIPFEGEEKNWECPLLFPLGKKWVLIYSPHGPVKYYTGTFDPKAVKFTPERHGTVDAGNFYAPNCLEDEKGRRILWGWVNGFPEGKGWNGCMTLPRVLSLADDGSLIQTPLPELEQLRGKEVKKPGTLLKTEAAFDVIDDARVAEFSGAMAVGEAKVVGLRVRKSVDGKSESVVGFDGAHLDVDGVMVPVKLAKGRTALDVRLFIDRSVLEVYADGGRVCVTKLIPTRTGDDRRLSFFGRGGSAALEGPTIWSVGSIWEKPR
jgi:sucrose-6-phosphate hydrolase SacC (GH32 family)